MNREELRKKLQLLLHKKFSIQSEQLEDALRLNEDLRMDSMMIVRLIVHIELDLKLAIPDDSMDSRAFSTIGSLLDFMGTLQPLTDLDAGTEWKVGEFQ